MLAYILKRLLLMIPTLVGISLVVFALVQVVPGGPVEQAIQRMKGVGGGAMAAAGVEVHEVEGLHGVDMLATARDDLMTANAAGLLPCAVAYLAQCRRKAQSPAARRR